MELFKTYSLKKYAMKKYLLTISTLLFCLFSYGQANDSLLTKTEFHSEISNLSGKIKTLEKNYSDSIMSRSQFHSEISKLTRNIKMLEKNNAELKHTNSIQKNQIDSINLRLSVANSNIRKIADSLHITVSNILTSNRQTQNQIKDINQTITNRTLYWIIGILAVALLSLIVFLVLRNKLSSNAKYLSSQIVKTNETLQNEAIKLDSKLVEILQSQLSILKEERKTKATPTAEPDHKLPLRVGDEIHRMRKRLENMPPDVKGLSALKNSLQRLEEEFNEDGYTMEDLLYKKYVDGMKLEARFVDNPDIPKGEEIITDVLRPEIRYKGVVIRVAKVEVGKSY